MSKSEIIVKWRMRGTLAIDGIALLRNVGDEDIVEERLAKKMALCGQVEIIGPVDGLEERTLPEDLDIEALKPEPEEDNIEFNAS